MNIYAFLFALLGLVLLASVPVSAQFDDEFDDEDLPSIDLDDEDDDSSASMMTTSFTLVVALVAFAMY